MYTYTYSYKYPNSYIMISICVYISVITCNTDVAWALTLALFEGEVVRLHSDKELKFEILQFKLLSSVIVLSLLSLLFLLMKGTFPSFCLFFLSISMSVLPVTELLPQGVELFFKLFEVQKLGILTSTCLWRWKWWWWWL